MKKMTEDQRQRYLDARVEGAQTLGEYYSWCEEYPEVFVAGVQYALDKILGESERHFAMVLPPYPSLGGVVTLDVLNAMAVDILEKAKRGEPQ